MNIKRFLIIFFTLFLAMALYAGQAELIPDAYKGADLNKLKSDSLNAIAYSYLKTNPSFSILCAGIAFERASAAGDSLQMLNANLLMGIVHKTYGNYDQAASYYFKALHLSEQLGLREKESACLNNISSMYQSQNNNLKALEYFKKSLQIETLLQNKSQISIRLYNIGAVYEMLDSLDKAYSYFFNSLLLEEEMGNAEGIIYALYGMSGIESKKGNYGKAYDDISKALATAQSTRDPHSIALCYLELGTLKQRMQNLNEAAAFFDSCIVYAAAVNQRKTMLQAYRKISEISAALGNFNKAYSFLLRYSALNDSINSAEINSRVAKLEAGFLLEKSEAEIINLRKNQELLQDMARSEKRNNIFLLITFILSALLALSNLGRILSSYRDLMLYTIYLTVALLLLTIIVFISGFAGAEANIALFLRTFVDILTISILPILIAILLAERYYVGKHLRTAEELSKRLQVKKEDRPVQEPVYFYPDPEKKDVMLSLTDIICIEGEDNYSAFYYIKNGAMTRELFRTTLKTVEAALSGHEDFIRCHKSYIVNIRHIKRISGNAQGYRLHPEGIDIEIPVSRSFPKELMGRIRAAL